MATTFKLKNPVQGQIWNWQVVDWLGQMCISGNWNVGNEFVLPDLSLGYYRLQVKNEWDTQWQSTIPFTRVIDPSKRVANPDSPFNIDSAQSAVVPAYPSGNILQPADTYRVVSDMEKLAGFSMIRDRISWGEVNPQPDVYNWGKYLTNARLLTERGIMILNVFNDAPAWVREGQNSMPSNLSALYQFTKAAVTEFKGMATAWEFWNEQDKGFWQDTPWDYAAAQKVAYLGYKAGDPQVNVLLGSTALHPVTKYNSFMDVVLQNEVGDYFDTYNFHNYEPVDQFASIMEDERNFLTRNGVENKPMWITESGLFYEGNGGKDPLVAGSGLYEHNDVQERDQAEYMVKEQIAAQSLGVEKNFSFVFPPYNENGGKKVWGILGYDYLAKPAYSALSNLTAQLANCRYLGQYKVTDGVEGYLYEDKGDNKQTLVLWSTVDQAQDITLNNSASQLKTADFVGKSGTLTPTGGNYNITVTKYPVYIHGFENLNPTTPAITPVQGGSRNDKDLTTIVRIKLGNNFKLFGKAAAILTNGTEGSAILDIYNFSDHDKQGNIENLGSGYEVNSLPSSVNIPSMGKVSIPVTIRIIDDTNGINIKIGGTFDSKPISQVYVPLANVNLDTNPNLVAKELPVADATRWVANSNGAMVITNDAQENAAYFHITFPTSSNNWVYPEFPLNLPAESMADAVGVSFDIKADNVLNGFNYSYLMTAIENIHETGNSYLFDYSPMTTSWQKVFIQFEGSVPAGFDPAAIKMLRLGANPNQSDFAYSVRNFKVYYPKTTQSVPTTIHVNPASVNLNAGDSQTDMATVYDQNNNIMSGLNVSWSSDNTSIADVSQSGVITAKAAGIAVVSATCGSLTAQVNVTVNQNTTPPENLVPHTDMTATASSYEAGNEASMAIDGNINTFWHSSWSTNAPLPQSITLQLGNTYNVNGINYLPRQDGNNHGSVTRYNIYVSTDGSNFTKVVSDGEWADDATEKSARFTGTSAGYVKLEVVDGGAGFASAAELNVTYTNTNKFDSNVYYIITNKNSGKCLNVNGESTADGAQIIQWPYAGGANEQWQIVDVGNGYYKIVNKNSGKCLNVKGESTADGAQIIQWPYSGGANEQWRISVNMATEPPVAPVLGVIGDKTVDEGQQLTFALNVTAANDATLVYNATGLPADAIFDVSSGTFTWTPGYDQAGTYKVTFGVSDGSITDSEDVNIMVNNVNRAPVINPIEKQTVDEGKNLKFDVSASDPDGDKVTVTPSNLPEGAVFDTASGVFLWEPDFTGAGEYTIHFEASDGSLRTGVDVGITVRNVTAKELSVSLSVYMNSLNLNKQTKNLLVKEMDDVTSRLDKKQYKQALVKLKVFMLEIKILSPRIIPKAQADFIHDECVDIIMAIKADVQGQDKSLYDKKINEILDKLKKLKEKNETDGAYEKVTNAIDEFVDRMKE